MAAVDARVVDWVISSGRRSAALRALASADLLTAAQVSRRTGRTTQNASQGLKELEGAGLAETVGEAKQSWRSYRLTEAGRLVAGHMGAGEGSPLPGGRLAAGPAVEGALVRDLLPRMAGKPVVAHVDEPLERVMARIIASPGSRTVYVVGGGGRLEGSIPLRRLLDFGERTLRARKGARKPKIRRARDLARPTVQVAPAETVAVALRKFRESGLDDLPVVNGGGALVGELNGPEVLLYLATLAVSSETAHGRGAPSRSNRAAQG
jgi:CBS domain-containing protein